MIKRRPIIGVMGSHEREWRELAYPVGKLIAEYDCHLLTGAGAGVMSAVASAFTSVKGRTGQSIGIVPIIDYDGNEASREQYPNPYIEIPILTPLAKKASSDINPFSRNYVNIMTSQAIIVLPGEHGTQNEVSLALQFHKKMILFGPEVAFKGFPEQVTHVEEIDSVREFLDSVIAGLEEFEDDE